MKVISSITVIVKCILMVSAGIVVLASLLCFFLSLRPVVVISGSMEPEMKTGSLAFVDTEEKKMEKGDIAAFDIENQMVTHRIVRELEEGYVTKGDANKSEDSWIVKRSQIRGKTVFSLPELGYAVKAVTSTKGLILLISVLTAVAVSDVITDRRRRSSVF